MKKLILLLLFTSCSHLNASDLPLDTVDYVNLKKYSGTWYEIARFDHSFQKGCTQSKANYSFRKDGDISVVNECLKDGKIKKATGRAWIADKDTNAKLKVQFFLSYFRIPFLSGNYWILDLDEDYTNVIIGDPSRKYLWFLSRNKTIQAEIYQELIDKAEDMHFDTSKLIKANK